MPFRYFLLLLLALCAAPAHAQLQAKQVVSGVFHSCALVMDGTVRCWGLNSSGQLGDSSTAIRTTPVAVAGLSGVTALAAGDYHTCAVVHFGAVRCWGSNSSGQLGDGGDTNSYSPVAVAVVDLSEAQALTAGPGHTCALLTNSTVRCWGKNDSGQLGDGSFTNRLTPVKVADLAGVTALAAGGQGWIGGSHTCAALQDGTARCWGDNLSGQLGDGSQKTRPTPVVVVGLDSVIGLATGATHTCALHRNGTARCWGANDYGQIGGTTYRNRPEAVVGLSDVTALAAGSAHTCALLRDGSVQCWGRGSSVGDGFNIDRATPVKVIDIADATTLSGGGNHSCALLKGGSVRCWGESIFGELGDGDSFGEFGDSYIRFAKPRALQKLTGVSFLAAGTDHMCAILPKNTVRCWGNNARGQLGDGTKTARPWGADVLGLEGASSLSTYSGHTCAVLLDGGMRCWGGNGSGQLGDGSTIDSLYPAKPDLSQVRQVAVGGSHTCALIRDGTVRCWGYNGAGQLGIGNFLNQSSPTLIPDLTDVLLVVAGSLHTCALLNNGTVRCWGFIGNGVGNVNGVLSSFPMSVPGLVGVTKLTAGRDHTCALLNDTSVRCWADLIELSNNSNGLSTRMLEPMPLPGLSGVVDIASEPLFVNTLDVNGKLRAWQISKTIGELKTTLPTLNDVQQFVTGSEYGCVLQPSGGVLCWGHAEVVARPPSYVEGFVRPHEFSAALAGTPAHHSLSARVRPAVTDVGEYRQVYVALRNPTTAFQPWFTYDGKSWSELTPLARSAYAGLLPESLSLPIFTDMNLGLLCGSEIYVGYGMYYQDMLDRGRWQKVATLCQ